MNPTIGFATSRNSQPLTQMNELNLEDLCDDGTIDSCDSLDREADTNKYITDREEEAREQTYDEDITSTKGDLDQVIHDEFQNWVSQNPANKHWHEQNEKWHAHNPATNNSRVTKEHRHKQDETKNRHAQKHANNNSKVKCIDCSDKKNNAVIDLDSEMGDAINQMINIEIDQ